MATHYASLKQALTELLGLDEDLFHKVVDEVLGPEPKGSGDSVWDPQAISDDEGGISRQEQEQEDVALCDIAQLVKKTLHPKKRNRSLGDGGQGMEPKRGKH